MTSCHTPYPYKLMPRECSEVAIAALVRSWGPGRGTSRNVPRQVWYGNLLLHVSSLTAHSALTPLCRHVPAVHMPCSRSPDEVQRAVLSLTPQPLARGGAMAMTCCVVGVGVKLVADEAPDSYLAPSPSGAGSAAP